jgi:hypothetical protein
MQPWRGHGIVEDLNSAKARGLSILKKKMKSLRFAKNIEDA